MKRSSLSFALVAGLFAAFGSNARAGPVARADRGASLGAASGGGTATDADEPHGSIVGWGSQAVGVDLSSGFKQVAAGNWHSLGADGSIVALSGYPHHGQGMAPAPNADFIAVAAGRDNSLGLKGCPSPSVMADVDFDADVDLADVAKLVQRLTGPGGHLHTTACHRFDLDADYDIDLRDVATFSNVFTGE